jgi:hypothetical protein
MIPRPRPARLLLEALEGRTTPATFTVTTLADVGAGSLRAAIDQANAPPVPTRSCSPPPSGAGRSA